MNCKILLIGKTGQVGRELRSLLPQIGEVFALDHSELDLSNLAQIRQAVRAFAPQLIVNAAAYTAVDRAESERAAAMAINAHAPEILADEAKKLNALLVHYSTDYVFDGSKRTPYSEEDPTNPQNVYGQTKLLGEQAIQQSGASHLIFRTAWVYERHGKNFLLTILKLATQREELAIVQDQVGAPTWSREIAAATVKALSAMYSERGHLEIDARRQGVFHMTAGGETSWFGFAKAILEQASRCPAPPTWLAAATESRPLVTRSIRPISTPEYPTPARRPAYSVLSNDKLAEVFGVRLPDWQTQLRFCFDS